MMRDAAFFFVCLGVGVYLVLSLIAWNLNIAEWTQLARFAMGATLFFPAMAFLTAAWEAWVESRSR